MARVSALRTAAAVGLAALFGVASAAESCTASAPGETTCTFTNAGQPTSGYSLQLSAGATVSSVTLSGGSGGSYPGSGAMSPGTGGQGAQLQFGPLVLPTGQQNVIAVFVGQSGSDVDPSALAAQTGPTDNSPQGASGGSSGSTSISNKQGGAGGSASVLLLNGQTFAVAGAGGGAISNADGGSGGSAVPGASAGNGQHSAGGRGASTSAAGQPAGGSNGGAGVGSMGGSSPNAPDQGSPGGGGGGGESLRCALSDRRRLLWRYEGANTGFFAGSGGGGSSFIDRDVFTGTETFSNVGSPSVTIVFVSGPVATSTRRVRRSRFAGMCDDELEYETRRNCLQHAAARLLR